MKILFICDYFPPFSKGGGEISSYWQAKKLTQQGVEVVVLAPKYQNRLKIKKENFKRYWYNFPFRLENTSPILFLNPFFFFYLLRQIIKACQKEKINLIHCQGKYSAPSSIFAKVFLKIPVILTLRDYKGICNHAFCLYKSKKSCNLFSFFKNDFLFYYLNYIKKRNIFSFSSQLIMSYFGRINTFVLSFFMSKADRFVCVSDYVGEVYKRNGYDKSKMLTVYNFGPETKIRDFRLPKKIQQKINQFKYRILYSGKLSLGKGAALLLAAACKIVKKRKDILFIFAGDIYFPIKKIKDRQLFFLGKVNQQFLFRIIELSNVICVPSLWPEPLSRVVIEAFFFQRPVLSSVVGGLTEFVSNRNGWLFEPTEKNLIKTIKLAFKKENNWPDLGRNGKEFLSKLEEKNIDKLIFLYKRLTR